VDPAEVRARFGRPQLAPLWAAVRHRLERAGGGPVTSVRLRGLDAGHRVAVAELLGLDRVPGDTVVVSLARLDAVVGQAVPGLDARGVVEALGGPLVDRAALRAEAAGERAALWAWLDAHPQVTAEPALATWAAAVRAGGVVGGSVAATRRLLERALGVLAVLPADGRPLPSLAEAACGDPHALDDGTRLGSLVVRGLAALRGVDVPTDAEGRRGLWEAFGVAGDALSTAVLVAGLRHVAAEPVPDERFAEGPAGDRAAVAGGPAGDRAAVAGGPAGDRAAVAGEPLAATLTAWAAAGQAAWVTLAQLRASPPLRVGADIVWVVENPSMVAEALRRFGAACPPLVCTSGWPTLAGVELLRGLAAGGAALRYHGDLDGEGVRIAAHVASRTGAQPWGMTTADYLSAVAAEGPPVGRVTEAPWDPHLAAAMRARGVAVPQERTCARLLDAMAPAGGLSSPDGPGGRAH
jgi:hypothetical protein